MLVCPAGLRKRLGQLRPHPIGGYEWECSECHYHFSGHLCHATGIIATKDEYVDSGEHPVDHGLLLAEGDVFAAVGA
jgi:hypothetical protein